MLNVRAKRNDDLEGGWGLFLFEMAEPGAPIRPIRMQLGDEQVPEISFPPTAILPELTAQQLFDDLWAAGFRPSGAKEKPDPAGVIAAKDAHLSDLREITGKLLDRIPALPRG